MNFDMKGNGEKPMLATQITALFLLISTFSLAQASPLSSLPPVYSLPLNCTELMPESAPFTSFFEAIARSHALSDRRFSKRLFRLLALRGRLTDVSNLEQNPVDVLIRKTLCFYREQREPLKAVMVDDKNFLDFLKAGLKDLEHKVEDAVFNVQFEHEQRKAYERKVKGSEGLIETLKGEADRDAQREFQRLTQAAKKKVKIP